MSYPTRWKRLQNDVGWPFGPWVTLVLLVAFFMSVWVIINGLASVAIYIWESL